MKSSVRWLLFEYQGLELVILSKLFKTKKLAEKAVSNIPTASVGRLESAWSACQHSSETLLNDLTRSFPNASHFLHRDCELVTVARLMVRGSFQDGIQLQNAQKMQTSEIEEATATARCPGRLTAGTSTWLIAWIIDCGRVYFTTGEH